MFASKDGNKARELWDGRGPKDASAGDLSLCNYIAYYVGGADAVTIDRLFRESKRMREKWDKKHAADGRTYGAMTIDKALDDRQKYWRPGPTILMNGVPLSTRPSRRAAWAEDKARTTKRAGDNETGRAEAEGPDGEDEAALGDGPPAAEYEAHFQPAARGQTVVHLTRDGVVVATDQINLNRSDQRARLVREWCESHPEVNPQDLSNKLLRANASPPRGACSAAEGGARERDDDPHKLARLALPILEEEWPDSWRTWHGDAYLWRDGEYERFSEANANDQVTRAVKEVVDDLAAERPRTGSRTGGTAPNRLRCELPGT